MLGFNFLFTFKFPTVAFIVSVTVSSDYEGKILILWLLRVLLNIFWAHLHVDGTQNFLLLLAAFCPATQPILIMVAKERFESATTNDPNPSRIKSLQNQINFYLVILIDS